MSVSSTKTPKQHIESTPGVCGGRPRIAGTRIRVQDIYIWHELQRQSPDEIVSQFPQLTLADVYAAMAYFWDNRPGVLAAIEEDRQLCDEMKEKLPSPLDNKIATMKANGGSLPS